ncbi:helix-turn-helix transcriptional regulator [Nocardioides humilatus]|uniref:Helix-turn-helix transcriptional regulator n=1 Tax=Nocardioides humilatus TaxID=2607660 RepID=A0A5B1L6Z8_9ACTN|nr:helix-turn-helix transcriptional regulator [Nocardioides humilatus]KAA1415499.1 helix-turn-helix transcriptional regulator [Nocardioides humilatus]
MSALTTEQVHAGPGHHPGVALLATGAVDIRRQVHRLAQESTEVLSVIPAATILEVAAAQGAVRDLSRRGVRQLELYDVDGIGSEARALLANGANGGSPLLCRGAKARVHLFDRRRAVVAGPAIGGAPSLLLVTDPPAVQSAMNYFRKAQATAVPVASADLEAAPLLSVRQWQIASLMADDLGDATIAARLDLSIRTVRSEVAAILTALDTRSRFTAGMRLGAHLFVE